MPFRKAKKEPSATEPDAEEVAPSTSTRQVKFLPCPGLSTRDLEQAREQYSDYYQKKGRRPAEKVKYTIEDKEQIDYVREATVKNVWYYKDRLMVSRGPCNLHVLRDAWVHGVIDENTLVWGQGLADWLPIRNVRTLIPQIRVMEVQVATWLKKTFGLRPALKRMRKARAQQRPEPSTQVDKMY